MEATTYHVGAGPVAVLEVRPALARVRKADGTEVWVRRGDLFDLYPGEGDDVAFVRALGDGYVLQARVADDAQRDECGTEYAAWTGGLVLEDDGVYVRPRAKHLRHDGRGEKAFQREWRLSFRWREGLWVPFPLRPIGTARLNGVNVADDRFAAGIFYPRNQRVDLYWVCIVERLVRAGLRARGKR
jgi:hypothetical protein